MKGIDDAAVVGAVRPAWGQLIRSIGVPSFRLGSGLLQIELRQLWNFAGEIELSSNLAKHAGMSLLFCVNVDHEQNCHCHGRNHGRNFKVENEEPSLQSV